MNTFKTYKSKHYQIAQNIAFNHLFICLKKICISVFSVVYLFDAIFKNFRLLFCMIAIPRLLYRQLNLFITIDEENTIPP